MRINSLFRVFILLSLISGLCTELKAQTHASWKGSPSLQLEGYADLFYAYDFNMPVGDHRQAFLFNHNRHQKISLNQGMLKLGLQHPRYRANLALHEGTYPRDNYAEEPGFLKNLFEANLGIALDKNGLWWIDTGVFGSHIGFESALSMDNVTLTRSILAENSPYYLSGAKISFEPNNKWLFSFSLLNGWQKIKPTNGNILQSFGSQVNYKPSEKTTFNWSTFVGSNTTDNLMRYFNNLYTQIQLGRKFHLTGGFDAGFQQRERQSHEMDFWFSNVLILQYSFSSYLKTAWRAEYYQDRKSVLIPRLNNNGFSAAGASWNIDYAPHPQLVFRLESRWLHSKDAIFQKGETLRRDNFVVAASVAGRFSKAILKSNLTH